MSNSAVSESCYPYTAKDGNCKTSCPGETKVKQAYRVNTGEDNLKSVSATRVVTVLVDASQWSYYSGGIYDGQCGTGLDHAVTLTGYGTDNG